VLYGKFLQPRVVSEPAPTLLAVTHTMVPPEVGTVRSKPWFPWPGLYRLAVPCPARTPSTSTVTLSLAAGWSGSVDHPVTWTLPVENPAGSRTPSGSWFGGSSSGLQLGLFGYMQPASTGAGEPAAPRVRAVTPAAIDAASRRQRRRVGGVFMVFLSSYGSGGALTGDGAEPRACAHPVNHVFLVGVSCGALSYQAPSSRL
jgi:hypothetical protein